MKQPKEIKPNHVLCGECKKPIHIDEFGGLIAGTFYHKSCAFIKFITEDDFLISLKQKG